MRGFAGTIRDNIAYGRPDGADDDIIVAVDRSANADEFNQQHAARLRRDGRRARRRALRAVSASASRLRAWSFVTADPGLDEPTAALDTESERLVIEALRAAMKGRTVQLIAHRLARCTDVDKDHRHKDGVVVEKAYHQS